MGSWNYRICTRLEDGFRVYRICECYYDDGSKIPHSYVDTKQILVWDNPKDLVKTIELLQSVPKKQILDLDNWPNEYKKPKKIKDAKDKDKA
jgi:hypothetical protein